MLSCHDVKLPLKACTGQWWSFLEVHLWGHAILIFCFNCSGLTFKLTVETFHTGSKHFGVSSFEAGHSRRQLCGCQWISSSLLSGLLYIGPRLIGHIANLLLCGSPSLNVFKFTIMVVNAWGSHLTVAVSLCEHIPAGFTKHKVNLVCRPHWAWWPYSRS